jgi:hypothetical protein
MAWVAASRAHLPKAKFRELPGCGLRGEGPGFPQNTPRACSQSNLEAWYQQACGRFFPDLKSLAREGRGSNFLFLDCEQVHESSGLPLSWAFISLLKWLEPPPTINGLPTLHFYALKFTYFTA